MSSGGSLPVVVLAWKRAYNTLAQVVSSTRPGCIVTRPAFQRLPAFTLATSGSRIRTVTKDQRTKWRMFAEGGRQYGSSRGTDARCPGEGHFARRRENSGGCAVARRG